MQPRIDMGNNHYTTVFKNTLTRSQTSKQTYSAASIATAVLLIRYVAL